MKRSGSQHKDPHKGFRPSKPLQRGRKLKARVPSNVKTVAGASERAIRDENDELVRKILRLRDHSCMTADCFRTSGLHVSHFIKRGVLALRWDLRNCNRQCDPCNALHNSNPAPYRHAMLMWYGEARVKQLERIGKDNPRLEYTDLLEIRDGLRRELEARKAI